MTDETEVDDKKDNKATKLVARILYSMDTKGEAATEAEGEDEAGYAAKKKEYMKKARGFVRRLEKKGVKVVAEG